KLTVLARLLDLGKQVFVQVALHILEWLAILLPLPLELGVELVNDRHRLDQQRGLGNDEDGILHVAGEISVATVHALDEREDVVADVLQHLLGGQVTEATPAQILPGPGLAAAGLVVAGEERLPGPAGERGVAPALL